MAQITLLQPLDFLKNSRTTLNQNFTNLNLGLSALSASLGSVNSSAVTTLSASLNVTNSNVTTLSADLNTTNSNVTTLSADVIYLTNNPGVSSRNLEVVNNGRLYGQINDTVNVRGANVFIGTLSPLLNGNITLSANNGYIKHITDGPGTQFIDDLQQTAGVGTWVEFYRANALSSSNVLNGSVYIIADAPHWPIRDGVNPNEGLQFYGNTSNTSLFLGAGPGYTNGVPSIYIPSINNSSLSSTPIELVGPNGALVRKLQIGNAPLYSPVDAPPVSSVNLNIFTDNTSTVYLSAAESTTTLQIGSVGAVTFTDSSVQTTAWTGNYTPTTPSDWNGTPPTTVQQALDRIAAAIKVLNSTGP